MTKMKLVGIALLSTAFLFFTSCEKEQLPTPNNEHTEAPSTVNSRSSGAITYAVTAYRPGNPAEIYTIDAINGDISPNHPSVPVTSPSGIPIENVTGITRIQALANPAHPEPFFVISLGDNSLIPGLPGNFSNNVWEVDINTGQIIALFKNTQRPITDICAADFSLPYWYPNACQATGYYVTGMGMVGIERDPRGNDYHLVYFDSYDNCPPYTANFDPFNIPIKNLAHHEIPQGLTWVRDYGSGCSFPGGMLEDALTWYDQFNVAHPSNIALVLTTYDPTQQEYKSYSLVFNQTNPTNLSVEAIASPNNPILPAAAPTLLTEFSLGWVSDEWTNQPGNMLMGGNLHQFPMPNTFHEFYDYCNPMLQNGNPTPNSIPDEVADFVSVPYDIW